MARTTNQLTFLDNVTCNLGGKRTADFFAKCNKHIPWEKLAESLKDMYTNNTAKGGASSWPVVMIIKCLMLQKWFNLSDPMLEEMLLDRLSFRWSIETTFQEMRRHLEFETTQQWTKQSVLRMAPLLLGLFSVVSLIYARHLQTHRVRVRTTPWYVKSEPTFSDAIATVRRLLWDEILFKHPCFPEAVQKIPAKFRQLLLERLACVA